MEAGACSRGSKTTLSSATARWRPRVARDGSIDWLCLPRFDSGVCFAALLGTPEHGRWLIAPVGGVRKVDRRYRPGTLVLETVFETDDGEVAVIDFMPPRSQVPELIRVVEGRRGRVPMHLELVIRFDYGSIIPWVRHLDRHADARRTFERLLSVRNDVGLLSEIYDPAPGQAAGKSSSGLFARRPGEHGLNLRRGVSGPSSQRSRG